MKALATFLCVSVVLVCGLNAPAQIPVMYPTPQVTLRSAAELDEMLAPIALYPDPLLAELLPAATYPADIVLADRFFMGGGDPGLIDEQPWDPSVKALARYLDVLKWLDDNLSWTVVVGQAFLYQPQDVMDSIQRLRARAMETGSLQVTQGVNVISEDGLIEILPSEPEVIYVPVYQSEVIYIHASSSPHRVSWRGPFKMGVWLNHDCDWLNHRVIVWGRENPRPAGWWSYSSRSRHMLGEVHPGVWHRHDRHGMRSRDRDPQSASPATTETAGTSDSRQNQSTVHVIRTESSRAAHQGQSATPSRRGAESSDSSSESSSSVTQSHSSEHSTQHSNSGAQTSHSSQTTTTSRDTTSTQYPNTGGKR